jgi:hypothetical protein
MFDSPVFSAAAHAIIGGLAANLLLIFSIVNVAIGGQGSHVSPKRRLPSDSDAKFFVILFAAGAACGLIVATATQFSPDPIFLAASGGAAFVAGLLVALPRVARLNEAYLKRAAENLEQGRYKEALEDAREVARSSERLRPQANQIIDVAQESRRQQPLDMVAAH